MPESIRVNVPRRGVGSDLSEALAAHGLRAEILEADAADDVCELDVTWAGDERERLLAGAIHAIEVYLSEHDLPLVVQRASGGAVVRPPGD